ncbi:MAG: GNAT family N-acetyltransferase [Thermoplasmatales archaeon]|nr:GNAT family N-acetyltransferase [Thermoplasmatales archaeon]MCK4995258.1 GNAT family N-acetyltransferase [Thermoplasmatales archaeon]
MDSLQIKLVTNKEEFEHVINIRKEVFIKGQNVPLDIEIDGLDSESEHFIAYLGNEPIGCARIRTNKKYARLERIAIIKKHRCKGFGTKLTNFLIDYCRKQNYVEIVMHSQNYVIDFYKKFGFKTRGETFLEANIEHKEMVLDIS